jgi:diguanylate cyclase (GGDEF)-like protein
VDPLDNVNSVRHRLSGIANSLVTRLMLVSVLVLALGTAATYFQITRFLRDDLTKVISAQQLALAQHVARNVDRTLADRRQFLEHLALLLTPEVLSRPGRLNAWLASHDALAPTASAGLAVVGVDGRPLGATAPRPGAAVGAIGNDPCTTLARAGRTVIGRPHREAGFADPILPIAVPVRDGAGTVVAVLAGGSTLQAGVLLDGRLQSQDVHPGGLLLISPQDRLFLASTDPRMVLRGTPPPGVNPLHDRAMAGFRGTGTTVDADGIEELAAIASVPMTGWFVVARLPVSQALATVARMRRFMLQQRVPVMLVVLALVGFGALRLLRPLRHAAEQADRMARAELAPAPLPVVRPDEVGRLTAAFNRLLSRLEAQRHQLTVQAHHDSLTGLPNRRLLADRLQQALARARRHDTCVAVLFLDLDGFKRINDSAGHETGDDVLRQVAARLLAVVRETDTVARLGGDEFVLLAADVDGDGEASARALAEKCIEAIGAPLHVREASHLLGVSIGIAVSGGEGRAEAILAAADEAMYTVKQGASVGYAIAEPS